MIIYPHQDVIIIGAGMVGLSCALALAKTGSQVTVVETHSQQFSLPVSTDPFDTKVVAITRASEIFLEQLEIWATIKTTRSCAYDQMKVWDHTSNGYIAFSALDSFEENLGHIVEHRVVMAALWQKITTLPAINILQGIKPKKIEQQAQGACLTLENEQVLTATLIIGADGVNSFVRKQCQIRIIRQDYQQTALVATIAGTKPHHQTAYQRFATDGPLALLPLANSHQFSIVWTTTPENAVRLMQLNDENFNQELSRESDQVHGECRLLSNRLSFPLSSIHAENYVVPRCVLVGDAAHSLHPLAGQGVNIGFSDVIALVNVINTARAKGKDFGGLPTLKKYERACKMHNQIMIWAMGIFKWGFGSQKVVIQGLRNFGLNWVNNKLSLKQFMIKVALGNYAPQTLDI